MDWYQHGNNLKEMKKFAPLKVKARNHLSAKGWVFYYVKKGQSRKELRYGSTSGKVYISLRMACKGFIDEHYSNSDFNTVYNPKYGHCLVPEKNKSEESIKHFTDFPKECSASTTFISFSKRRGRKRKVDDSVSEGKPNLHVVEEDGSGTRLVGYEEEINVEAVSKVGHCLFSGKKNSEESLNPSTLVPINEKRGRKKKTDDSVHQSVLAEEPLLNVVRDGDLKHNPEEIKIPEVSKFGQCLISGENKSEESLKLFNTLPKKPCKNIRQYTRSAKKIKIHDSEQQQNCNRINPIGVHGEPTEEINQKPNTSCGKLIADMENLKDKFRREKKQTSLLLSKKRVRENQKSNSKLSTVLSMLIENDVVQPGNRVQYRGREGSGKITSYGIECDCCFKMFTLGGFEAHVGSTNHRPAAYITLEDGRSLCDCQKQLKSKNELKSFSKRVIQKTNKTPLFQNDDICFVCHYDGTLILCDACPYSFHVKCLGLKAVPDGNWFCPSCYCGICGRREFQEANEHVIDVSLQTCDQCERKFHIGCLRNEEVVKLERKNRESWFCGSKCENIFWGLRKILGKRIQVGSNDLTWTLWKSINFDGQYLDPSDKEKLAESYTKLNVALSVMQECFEPCKNPKTNTDLVKDAIFCKESELKRLNFKGFYTVVLERNDEVISVAIVRVYGEKVAEVPLVGTRFQYRRMGMCSVLMGELENQLVNLGVERLTLPAAPSVLNTWTMSFGFSKMTDIDRLKFLSYTFLDFQGTLMCHKLLKGTKAENSRPSKINLSSDCVNPDASSGISEVSNDAQGIAG